MFIKINNGTKVVEEYSEVAFDIVSEEQYQLNTTHIFRPSLDEAYWKHIKGHIFDFICYKDKRAFLDNQYTYSDFIQLITLKKIVRRLQYTDTATGYKLWFMDGSAEYFCLLRKDVHVSDVLDFEIKYKNTCNLLVDMVEEETGLLKFKPREVEATLFLPFVYFTTGVASSLDQGNLSLFDIDTSVSGTTKITYEPNYGYYIDGGGFKLLTDIPDSFSIKGTLILAPLVPVEYGGHVVLVHNKKLLNANNVFTLNVPPKYVKYYSYMPIASTLEFTVEHGDANIDIELYVKIYK